MSDIRQHENGNTYRKLFDCPGKDAGGWVEGLVYIGCYDGLPRWTSVERWNRFVSIPDRNSEPHP